MKPQNLKKVLVIGSGPIIIGQAAEFDYSGTQACKVLKEEGLEVVLINSNPATIMTDTKIADSVYIEPLTPHFIEKIIAKERPDGIICGMGGQIALNLAIELSELGILDKYNTKLIGTNLKSIAKAEDRDLFKKTMEKIGQPVIESSVVSTMEEAYLYAEEIGYPIVVRPGFTMGGTGGGIAYDKEELTEIASKGIQFSRVNQILLEKCVKGWKEIEYEMMRDNKGNVITVCNMENLDPVGVHTGDSIVVAPSQTLSDKEYQMLRKASIDIVNELEIVGGCNVQIALDPHSFNYFLIEVNPRVSRSSALASKATGYPIAKVAAQIAIGYNLDEIKNEVTGKTMACFEPTLDYCVVKIPKWAFDKFDTGYRKLGTMMMATGEVMAIGNNFESALLKGIRSLETKQYSLDYKKSKQYSIQELKDLAVYGDDERLFHVAELIRQGVTTKEIWELTEIDMFFLEKIKLIVDQEEILKNTKLRSITKDQMQHIKKRGVADKAIAMFTGSNPMDVYKKRKELDVLPVYKMVDTCGGEFDAISNYYYSTYDFIDEVEVSDKKKVIVIGSGPIRIGQGVEFDYCSVHGVLALKEQGIEAIIINNNPETVSTDFDISDKLYFEPITEEDVLSIIDKEKPDGVILQYGGQTAIKLASFLSEMGIEILGTSAINIDNSEDREKFDDLLERCDIARPEGVGVMTLEAGIKAGEKIGYPVMVRPSYVLGGAGMEIVYNPVELELYLKEALIKDKKNPVLVDKYLTGLEIEVDAICDGTDILIPGIMEHLERAGVHSGDSIAIYPAYSFSQEIKDKVVKHTETLARELNVIGLINIQYVLYENEVYVIEVNPRASRTVPYISKVTGIPMIEVATQAMLGLPIKDMGYGTGLYPERDLIAVKVPVFSMEKIPNIEIALGPEMRSTGEILSIEKDLHKALYKGFISANIQIPEACTVLASVSKNHKEEFLVIAKELDALGFNFMATSGTKIALEEIGIKAELACKIGLDGRDVIEVIKSGDVDLVINIPNKGRNARTDGFKIRRASVEKKINCLTALDTLRAIVNIKKMNLDQADLNIYDICDLSV